MASYSNEELMFGLDIGTRTIIGTVGYKENNKFVVLAYESIEHEERAMLDGQIHDIQKVSRAVCQVKTSLEQKLNTQLSEVAIAAAGRALNTQIVSVENTYEEVQEFTLADVHNLELYGVEKAKEEQRKINSKMDYFCVAYSVINYYLDGYIITSLEGHKGTNISAKIIVTFLPKLVIDSLYAVTERAGLKVINLTLEPIAAINAVIPDNLRLLNLALVDIGAGTSDIAITKGGSVTAYGMIPIAGDEVTEAIVHQYLVDFNTAETIKKQLHSSEMIEFSDILGLSHQVTVEEVRQIILPVLETLTQNIAEKILELNGDSPPNAVFCVGGGSQMLSVTAQLAKRLRLVPERVALRTSENVVNIIDQAGIINAPQMITPLGICITSMHSRYNEIITVILNDRKIELLKAKKLTILDAIVAAGIEHTEIFPKKGKTLMFKLNGERQRLKGENGMPARIFLNGNEATINDILTEEDIIQVEKAKPGTDGQAVISQYISEMFEITVNGAVFTIPIMMVNNDCVPLDYQINENDDVRLVVPSDLGALLDLLSLSNEDKIITVNFNRVALDYKLQKGDSILIDDIPHTILEDISHEVPLADAKMLNEDHLEKRQIFITVNNQVVVLPEKETPYMLAAIFDYIPFDLTKPQGTIQLIKNGEPAALTDDLNDKDKLEIYWKK
ncbi:cell division protein FtsA [Cellulosilyticum sp. I15G10I2]|uniref:cell division protein FtsA n=1 Tax=Cellulosilyticum sp. I15G10I2 TaxID=1892843 RepID=UPI00085C14FC|nr:cell division protein FtsA [Cellulosilyticum sp. I15G10I2]